MDPAEEFFRNIKQNMKFIKIGLILLVPAVLVMGGTFIIPPK